MVGVRVLLVALVAALFVAAPAEAGVSVPSKSARAETLLKRNSVLVRVNGPRGALVRLRVLPRFVAFKRTVRMRPGKRRSVRLKLKPRGRRSIADCSLRRLKVRAVSRGKVAKRSRLIRRRGSCPGGGGEPVGPPTPTPTATATLTATATASSSPSPTATASPSVTATTTVTATPTATATATATATPAPPVLTAFPVVPFCDFLDPAVCLLPFPNDRFTRADASTPTGRRLNLDILAMPRNIAQKPIDPSDYNRNDGFSPGSPIVTRIPGLDNQAAFDRTGLVPQTDLARAFDADQPVVVINAETGQRQMIWAELDSNPPTDAERTLVIRPAKNLAEGERFIVALRNLKTADGTPIAPQQPFRLYRDNVPTLLNPLFEQRRAHMETIFADLGRAGIARNDLYLAWDFTVASEQDRTGRAAFIRDEAFEELGDTNLADLQVPANSEAPEFSVDTVTPTPDHPTTAFEIDGSYTVPCFLFPDCEPGGRFLYTSPTATEPVRIPTSEFEAGFRCIVPKSAVAPGAPPARPSLYGHGLFGTRGEVGQGQVRNMTNEHNMVYCATDWMGMSTAGGLLGQETFGDIPIVATILLDLSGFPMLADRVQQGLLNFMYLGRLMIHPDGLGSDPAFRTEGRSIIDQTRLYYDGNSQGGIIGGALMALSPDATRGVLGVPGMNYSTLLNRSVDFESDPEAPCPPDFADLIAALTENPPDPTDPESILDTLNFSYACPLYAAYPNHLERQLIFSLMQQLWDRAEGNGYAHHMTSDPIANTPAHEVLLHVGLGDHQVAQLTAEVEARTIGAGIRSAGVDPGRHSDVEPFYGINKITSYPFAGSALEIWDSGDTPVPPAANVPPRAGEDPHEEPRNTKIARAQKSAFMQPSGKVIDTCGGQPCYSRGYKGSE